MSSEVCVCVCVRAGTCLRSLSRAEMVVRRRPLSLLDSEVAIWYSSFSMEKGLAIQRHFRSWKQEKKRGFINENASVTTSFCKKCWKSLWAFKRPVRIPEFHLQNCKAGYFSSVVCYNCYDFIFWPQIEQRNRTQNDAVGLNEQPVKRFRWRVFVFSLNITNDIQIN